MPPWLLRSVDLNCSVHVRSLLSSLLFPTIQVNTKRKEGEVRGKGPYLALTTAVVLVVRRSPGFGGYVILQKLHHVREDLARYRA